LDSDIGGFESQFQQTHFDFMGYLPASDASVPGFKLQCYPEHAPEIVLGMLKFTQVKPGSQ
jgi:hypothetical protein